MFNRWDQPIVVPQAAPHGADAPDAGCACAACRPATRLPEPQVLEDAAVLERHPLGRLEL
jgi:hypothetical protein